MRRACSRRVGDRSPASIPGVSWRIATSGSLRFIEGCSSCCQLGPSKASRASSQAMPRQIQGMRFCRPAPPTSSQGWKAVGNSNCQRPARRWRCSSFHSNQPSSGASSSQ
ncbi:Uncharacterised protein [Acinetobacter baumannii]|nr:Uncharacterised protein [Acinetobacter baumannii]